MNIYVLKLCIHKHIILISLHKIAQNCFLHRIIIMD
jgi:hypothetical protein